MPKGDVETVFVDGTWTNQVEGEGPTGHLFQTKDRAVEAGRELARERASEHIIKNQDGTIGERSTYGDDPRDIPG
ncbi:DUF2188 domain-containing protein [Nocardioides sp. R1-1]|uniref:DUF2188 domain-containing protein n=1 Tax=Nocardioides sp. R1-1 TaxID=3383502 RepID=UPI0038D0CA46